MAAHQSPLLEAILFAFKEEICLRAPQTDNLWATISIFLSGDECQYQMQGLYQSHSIPGKNHSYTHYICTSGCRMHRGLTETHRSHACHHIFHTVVQWFEVGRVVPLSQDPKEVKGTLNSSGLNTIPTQTGAQEALTDKSKNCVFDCTKPQNFDKLIQKRDA